MTSEIVLMNQRAIAMAADSAVTVIDGGKIIVRNEQRKLFNLADGLPVGVMFFGLADLMGHPWDVLAEHYRTHAKPAPLPHVCDYGDSLSSGDAAFSYPPNKSSRCFPSWIRCLIDQG